MLALLCWRLSCVAGRWAIDSEALLDLLETDSPARGADWPRIPGPQQQDRVCVVGAGISGVHMAARLTNLGYNNVSYHSG